MQQSEEKAVCNDAVAPAAQCQQTFADDDDNTNSFDAFAFFLCLVKMSVYFHCQSVDQGGNLLGALTSAPTASSKKKRIENVLLLFFLDFVIIVRVYEIESARVSIMKCMEFYRIVSSLIIFRQSVSLYRVSH